MKKNKRKILFFDHDPKMSGSSLSLKYIIDELIKHDFEIYLLTPKDEKNSDIYRNMGVNVISNSKSKFKSFALSIHFSDDYKIFTKNWFITLFKNFIRIIVGSLITYKTIKNIKPNLIYINEHNMFYCAVIANKLGVKSLIHIRSNFISGNFGLTERIIARVIYLNNECIFAITPIEANQILKYNLDNKGKVKVLPEFLSDKDFICEKAIPQIREEFSLPLDKIIVVSFIGIDRLKGSIEYLESIDLVHKERADIFFVLAGEIKKSGAINEVEKYYKKVKKLLSNNIINENLKVIGFTDKQHELLFASDILVSPFQTSHFSRPVIEAWALKKAVISSDNLHSRSFINQDVDGLFFENSDELARNIIVIATDKNKRDLLANNGFKKAKNNFMAKNNLPVITEKIIKILEI